MKVKKIDGLRDGATVELTTGTVFADVRRESKTGQRWSGVLVTPAPGYPAWARPGMRLAFHESGVKAVRPG